MKSLLCVSIALLITSPTSLRASALVSCSGSVQALSLIGSSPRICRRGRVAVGHHDTSGSVVASAAPARPIVASSNTTPAFVMIGASAPTEPTKSSSTPIVVLLMAT